MIAATQVGRGCWYVSAPGNPDAWVLTAPAAKHFSAEVAAVSAAGGFNLTSRAEDFVQRHSIPPAACKCASVMQ